METQGLWENMKKTKVMCRGRDVDVLKDTTRFLSGECRHGGGTAAQITHTGYTRLAVDSRKKLAEDPIYR